MRGIEIGGKCRKMGQEGEMGGNQLRTPSKKQILSKCLCHCICVHIANCNTIMVRVVPKTSGGSLYIPAQTPTTGGRVGEERMQGRG